MLRPVIYDARSSQLERFSAWRKARRETPPVLLRTRSSSIFILVTVCVAVFTDIFLYAVIVPVIPFALSKRAGVPEQDVQHWVSVLLAVYGAALLGASPFCGWFADKSPNRRLPLLIGLFALGGATVLLCLGNSIALLVVGRVLQGISAAVVWTVGLALLADTVGPLKIGQSIGYVGISMSVAILIAPLLGGVVYDQSGYYPVYYMAFGMILLDILLRLILIEKKVAHKWHVAAAAAEELKTSSVVTSSSSAPSEPHQEQPASGEAPFPVRKMLRSTRLLAALFTTLIQSLLITAWDATLPLHVAGLFGWSSLGAGLIFLPILVPSLLAPLVGVWADRQGARIPVVLGFLIAIPFIVCLRFVDGPAGSDSGHIGKIVLLCILLKGVGTGLCMAMVPLIAEIVYVLEKECPTLPRTTAGPTGGLVANALGAPGAGIEHTPATVTATAHYSKRNSYATAYGLSNAAFAGGMLAGPLFGGSVRSAAGWGTMCWGLGVIAVAGAVGGLWVGEAWIARPAPRGSADEEAPLPQQEQQQQQQEEVEVEVEVLEEQSEEEVDRGREKPVSRQTGEGDMIGW